MASAPPGSQQPSSSLLIVGASARAAAQSARRAGFFVSAADAFCDCDLRQAAQNCLRIADYPRGIAAAVARDASDAWMYTGAMENHLDVIEQLSALRPLWGNSAAVIRSVRDPQQLFGSLTKAGFAALPWQESAHGVPTDGSWLRKPRRSAGGAAIARWFGETSAKRVSDRQNAATKQPGDVYYQQFQPGATLGLSFVGNGHNAVLLGISEHLRAAAWSALTDFQYVGSIGPIELPGNVLEICQRLGQFLTDRFGLRGLFGVDIVCGDQQLWLLEINPRYTASMELLERGGQLSLVQIHRDACVEGRLPQISPSGQQFVCGKLIVYAEQSLVISDRFTQLTTALNANCVWPRVADIPETASVISQGGPVCTVLSDGKYREQTLGRLADSKTAIVASIAPAEASR